jgi:mRNA interferase MazF
MSTPPNPSRGEVWDICFDPSVGAEIQKTRPAVVVNIASVGRLPLRMVVPITDWKDVYSAHQARTDMGMSHIAFMRRVQKVG